MGRALILCYGLFISTKILSSPCPEPHTIRDLVGCQNIAVQEASPEHPATMSRYIRSLSAFASLACTQSGASAQPAYPMDGDLRCFFVFANTTASFNIVEGINDNDIEVSQTFHAEGASGVLLGRFNLERAVTPQVVLTSGIENIPGTHMSCLSCHRAVSSDMVQVDGISTLVLKPIRINSTLGGTVPTNGQIPPEDLDRVLKDLSSRHKCPSTPVSETCLRIDALKAAPKGLPMDNPSRDQN